MRHRLILFLHLLFVFGLSDFQSTSKAVAADKEVPEKVVINDTEMFIYSQSGTTIDSSNSKPVLLFLHGGPGFAMMTFLAKNNSELLDRFIIVDWDQKGAGKSYDTDENLDMSFDAIVDDAHDLTTYLKIKHNVDKIYILGHSFGTMIGMMLVGLYPEDYHAYIGTGVAVDVVNNEKGSWDWALSKATEVDNQRAINQLNKIGDPGTNSDYPDYYGSDASDITMYWVGYFGGDLYGKQNANEIENEIIGYDIYKNESWEDGWVYSQNVFEETDLNDMDISARVTTVAVPVYFFMGVNDGDTPYNLAKEYYKDLNVSGNGSKTWIDFNLSAHFPFYEESEKFNTELIKILN
jgi:proline iminopeptidase